MTTNSMIILDTHPGEIIKEHMEDLGWTQRDLAQRLGESPKTVNLLIHHKTRINRGYAEAFSRIFGYPVDFWLNLEKAWEDNERLKCAEQEAKKHKVELTRFKYSELVKAKLIKDGIYFVEKVNAFLGFFRVASFNALDALIMTNAARYKRRQTKTATDDTLAVWIMACERVSEQVSLSGDYSEKAFKEALREIRQTMLTGKIDIEKLKGICAKAGVAVITIPPLKGLGVYGASFWHAKRPVIALAWNYSDDRFWFYFFHEASHILSDPQKEVFAEVKTCNDNDIDASEKRANDFAENILLPEFDEHSFPHTETGIKKYAAKNKVLPCIVVGRLKNRDLLHKAAFIDLVQTTSPTYDSLV